MSNYRQEIPFINRAKELQFLQEHIASEPNELLLVYGPKSSGKTTLINKFVETVQKNESQKYNFKQFNLRELTIANYDAFLQTFFLSDRSHGQIVEASETLSFSLNFHFFIISSETEKQLKEKRVDPFHVMKEELQKLVAKNIRPIIIIDELQALEGVYTNGQHELLKGIFNFFVAMTKESHLCHVIIASSDGYFLHRVYEDSKLKKTAGFFEVDYLNKEDTVYWLRNLEKESAIKAYTFTERQIETVWDFYGGSCWELHNFLCLIMRDAKDGKVTDEAIERFIGKERQKRVSAFNYYVNNEEQQKLLVAMNTVVRKMSKFEIKDLHPLVEDAFSIEGLKEELGKLAHQNFISFNPATTKFAMQGRSLEVGLELFAKEVNG